MPNERELPAKKKINRSGSEDQSVRHGPDHKNIMMVELSGNARAREGEVTMNGDRVRVRPLHAQWNGQRRNRCL